MKISRLQTISGRGGWPLNAPQLMGRLATKVASGRAYVARDLRDWNVLREQGKNSLAIQDSVLERLHAECVADPVKTGTKFTHIKTWNDAFVWLQVFKQLRINPNRILEVGSGKDPTLPIAAEAQGFQGEYLALDINSDVKEKMENEIKRMVSYTFSAVVGNIYQVASAPRERFDLLLFNHFFDDLFIGMYLEEKASADEIRLHFKDPSVGKNNWLRAINLDRRTQEFTRPILGLAEILPGLLFPSGHIIIREYISGTSCKPGSLMLERENCIRVLTTRVLHKLSESRQLKPAVIDFDAISGSPGSLFPRSFYAFSRLTE